MKIKLLTNVTRIQIRNEYPTKPDGSTDYASKKIAFYESRLTILDNLSHVEGEITMREKLEFGVLYEIFVSTDHGVQTAEIEELIEEETPQPKEVNLTDSPEKL